MINDKLIHKAHLAWQLLVSVLAIRLKHDCGAKKLGLLRVRVGKHLRRLPTILKTLEMYDYIFEGPTYAYLAIGVRCWSCKQEGFFFLHLCSLAISQWGWHQGHFLAPFHCHAGFVFLHHNAVYLVIFVQKKNLLTSPLYRVIIAYQIRALRHWQVNHTAMETSLFEAWLPFVTNALGASRWIHHQFNLQKWQVKRRELQLRILLLSFTDFPYNLLMWHLDSLVLWWVKKIKSYVFMWQACGTIDNTTSPIPFLMFSLLRFWLYGLPTVAWLLIQGN